MVSLCGPHNYHPEPVYNLLSTTHTMAVFRPASRRTARRFTRRSIKTRAPRTRSARSSTVMSVPRSRLINGFPETLTTTLKYCDKFNFTTASTSAVGNVFRFNSPFDPDFTGTGHQPLYFDQFTPVYSRYVVMGAKLTATFSPLSSSASNLPGPYTVGITANNDGAFSTDLTTLVEQNKSSYAVMGRDQAGNNVKTLYMTYDPLRDIGLSPDDDTVGAAVTTSPNSTYWVKTWVGDNQGSTFSVSCLVTIEMTVKFLRQTSVAQS